MARTARKAIRRVHTKYYSKIQNEGGEGGGVRTCDWTSSEVQFRARVVCVGICCGEESEVSNELRNSCLSKRSV